MVDIPVTDEEFLLHYGVSLSNNPTEKERKAALREAYQRMYYRIVNKPIKTLTDLYQ